MAVCFSLFFCTTSCQIIKGCFRLSSFWEDVVVQQSTAANSPFSAQPHQISDGLETAGQQFVQCVWLNWKPFGGGGQEWVVGEVSCWQAAMTPAEGTKTFRFKQFYKSVKSVVISDTQFEEKTRNSEASVKASVAGVAPSCFFFPPLPWIQLYNSWSRVQVSLDFHKWFLWVLEQKIIVLMSWGIAGAQKWECEREAIIDNDKAISLRCSVFLRKITMRRRNARRLWNMNLWEF